MFFIQINDNTYRFYHFMHVSYIVQAELVKAALHNINFINTLQTKRLANLYLSTSFFICHLSFNEFDELMV